MKSGYRSRAASPAAALVLAAAILGAVSCGARSRSEPAVDPADRMLRIGILFEAGGIADMSNNRSAYDGAVRLALEAHGRVEGEARDGYGDAFTARLVEVPAEADRRAILRSVAEEGRRLIFAIGFLFSDSIMSVAREYPDTRFVLVDGFVPDLGQDSNITCVSFAEQEGAFLMGACAGLLSIDAGLAGKVGFIGGIDMPIAHRYLAGYQAGAAWTNPALRNQGQVMWAFLGRGAAVFANTTQAAYYAASLIQQAGIRVLFNVSGAAGRGAVETAARLGVAMLGADMDIAAQYAASDEPAARALAPSIVASMLKRVDNIVYELGRAALRGVAIPGGYRSETLATGGISWVSTGLPKRIEELVAGLAERVASGEIDVPEDDAAAAEFIANVR